MITACKTCGKSIVVKPSRINPRGNYCSQACHYRSGAPRPGRKNGTAKRCEVCGTEFYAALARSEQQFCSLACKGIASRLPEKPCEVCGKMYKPRMGCSDRPCCSRKCGAIYRRNGKTMTCVICKSEFHVPLCQETLRKCCSRKCFAVWHARRKTSHVCKICGKGFRWSPSRQKSYKILYCSLACRDADPERRERLIQMNVRQQQGGMNKLERAGYAMLDELGIPYQPQVLLAGKFCVDAFSEPLGLVIQFDGDYWHGNPERFPEPDERQQRRMKLDRSQDAYLRKCGYRIHRIWESRFKADPEGIKREIRRLAIAPEHEPAVRASGLSASGPED